jgi:uncharacterized membrane protein
MDVWQIVAFVLGIVFNIGVVAAVRNKLKTKGEQYFFARGRGAMVILFVLCFAEKLVLGHFGALHSPEALIALVQQTLDMVGAAMGVHITGGAIMDALKKSFP